MRLIDADKLRHELIMRHDLIGAKYTDMADTVKAIPIEWLKAYFKKCLSFDDRVFIDNEDSNYDIVIDKYKIFEEWEKENEIDRCG